MRLQFTVAGVAQVDRRLMRMGDRAVDARPVWSALADDFIDWTDEQFKTEGRRASGGWAPLAESTIRSKGHAGILVLSGDLYRSLTGRGDPNMLLEIHPDWMAFGSLLEYFPFHQLGTSTLPERPPLELTEQDRKATVSRLQRFLMTGAV